MPHSCLARQNRCFHFERIFSCRGLLASATGGKSWRWLKGRQASMIAFEQKGASSGYVTYIGSFFDPIPRWMISMLVAGSERVATAHITSRSEEHTSELQSHSDL